MNDVVLCCQNFAENLVEVATWGPVYWVGEIVVVSLTEDLLQYICHVISRAPHRTVVVSMVTKELADDVIDLTVALVTGWM